MAAAASFGRVIDIFLLEYYFAAPPTGLVVGEAFFYPSENI